MIEISSCTCNQCGNAYTITQFKCSSCESKIEGNYSLPRLARLSLEERQFVELFVLTGGNIKKMEKAMSISYPTVKTKLDKIISKIRREIVKEAGCHERNQILSETN